MFNSNDFNSTEISISCINESTTTSPRGHPELNFNDIKLNELKKNGMILELSTSVCSTGHHLFLKFEIKKSEIKINFECSVKVMSAQNLNEHLQRIETELIRYNEKDWEIFNNYFTEEQNKALDLFYNLRGY